MKKGNFSFSRKSRALLLAACLLAALPAMAEDLSLERAVQLALERNERALAAGEQLRAAQGLAAQARAYFFPALSITGNLTRRPNAVSRQIDGQNITVQSQNAVAASAALS
jgi:outer membrane protein TolC